MSVIEDALEHALSDVLRSAGPLEVAEALYELVMHLGVRVGREGMRRRRLVDRILSSPAKEESRHCRTPVPEKFETSRWCGRPCL